jgi:hypothetical protein
MKAEIKIQRLAERVKNQITTDELLNIRILKNVKKKQIKCSQKIDKLSFLN